MLKKSASQQSKDEERVFFHQTCDKLWIKFFLINMELPFHQNTYTYVTQLSYIAQFCTVSPQKSY